MINFKCIGINTNAVIIDKIKDIYISSFPQNEQISFDYLVLDDDHKIENIQNGFITFGIFDDSNVVGLLSLYVYEELVFLLYFAIDNNLRGTGIGELSLQKLFGMFPDKIFILEIEHPTNETSIKRINFYKRNGVIIQDFKYLLPPLQENNPPLPMLIGTYPHSISRKEFETVKKILYRNIYNYSSE